MVPRREDVRVCEACGGITPLMHFTGKGTEVIYVPTTCKVCGELVQIDAEVW